MKKLTRNPFSFLALIGLLLVEYLNFLYLAIFSLVSQKAANARVNWAIKNLLEDSASSFSILAFASIASLLVIYHLCKKGQKERRIRIIVGSTCREQYSVGEVMIFLADLLTFALAFFGMRYLTGHNEGGALREFVLASMLHTVVLLLWWPLLVKVIDR